MNIHNKEFNGQFSEIESSVNFEVPFSKIDDGIANSVARDKTDAKKYKAIFDFIFKLLPENEQKEIFENPLDFTSKECLFRGLSQEMLLQFIETRKMIPQAGQLGRRAVFTTDSPFLAVDFLETNGGLTIFDRSALSYADPKIKIWNMDSIDFTKTITEAINILREHNANNDILYTIYNRFDTQEQYVPNKPWHVIALSQEQSIDAAKQIILINLNKNIIQDFEPKTLTKEAIREILETPV